MKRYFKLFVLITLFSVAVSCVSCRSSAGQDGNDDHKASADMYFVDNVLYEFVVNKINISDGSVYVPCPDPLCTHTFDISTCPFSKCMSYIAEDGGKYLLYGAVTASDLTPIINCYDTENNKTELVYESKTGRSNYIIYGDGAFYFDVPQVKTVDGVLIRTTKCDVMRYDPSRKTLSKFGEMDEKDCPLFAEDGYVIYRSGENGCVYRTTGSFDNSDIISLPSGHMYSPTDYWTVGRGFAARCYSPAEIYMYNEDRIIDMPEQLDGKTITFVTRTGDNFYFNVSYGYNYGIGDDFKSEEDGLHFKNTVCLLDKNGEFHSYDVHSNYSFVTSKGYGHCIIGRVLYKYDNGEELDENGFDATLIWIDLDTGRAVTYTNPGTTTFNIVTEEIPVIITENK